MTEEKKKPKITLIKQVVAPNEPVEETKGASDKEGEQKPRTTEKRRVVVVKKKVVKAKPAPKRWAKANHGKSRRRRVIPPTAHLSFANVVSERSSLCIPVSDSSDESSVGTNQGPRSMIPSAGAPPATAG